MNANDNRIVIFIYSEIVGFMNVFNHESQRFEFAHKLIFTKESSVMCVNPSILLAFNFLTSSTKGI